MKQIEEQEKTISKARKLYLLDKFEFDDFCSLKKEYHALSEILKNEIDKVAIKLNCLDKHLSQADQSFSNILFRYKDFDIADKKHIINLISPVDVDRQTGIISAFQLDKALSKILSYSHGLVKTKIFPNNPPNRFNDINVSIERAVTVLGRNNIQVTIDEAAVILDFFYVIAKNYDKSEKNK